MHILDLKMSRDSYMNLKFHYNVLDFFRCFIVWLTKWWNDTIILRLRNYLVIIQFFFSGNLFNHVLQDFNKKTTESKQYISFEFVFQNPKVVGKVTEENSVNLAWNASLRDHIIMSTKPPHLLQAGYFILVNGMSGLICYDTESLRPLPK